MSFGPGGNQRNLLNTAAQKQTDTELAVKAQQLQHFKTTLLTEEPPPFSVSGCRGARPDSNISHHAVASGAETQFSQLFPELGQ